MQKIKFSRRFQIGNRWIGQGEPVFIIAEIGVNHNGDMELAKKMIDVAADAGADAVKFQTFRTDSFMQDTGQMYEYVEKGKRVQESTYEMLKRLELPEEEHQSLFDYARNKNIIPLTTVTELHSIKIAKEVGAEAFKIASAGFTNYPLIKAVSQESLPLLISTGMSTQDEIERVCNILVEHNLHNVVFFHCVSLYPTPTKHVNLLRMKKISELTEALVAYSDHSEGIDACIGAVAMGACILEKHFTLDRELSGPDHAFSANPQELKDLIVKVREMEQLLGTGDFVLSTDELSMRKNCRPSLVYTQDLQADTVLEEKHIGLKWPGDGIHPSEMVNILGMKITKSVIKDEQIQFTFLK